MTFVKLEIHYQGTWYLKVIKVLMSYSLIKNSFSDCAICETGDSFHDIWRSSNFECQLESKSLINSPDFHLTRCLSKRQRIQRKKPRNFWRLSRYGIRFGKLVKWTCAYQHFCYRKLKSSKYPKQQDWLKLKENLKDQWQNFQEVEAHHN